MEIEAHLQVTGYRRSTGVVFLFTQINKTCFVSACAET